MARVTCSIYFVVCAVASALGFLPNHIGLDIPSEDFTLESITREALLRVTATFLQGQLTSSLNVSLVDLDPLTESSLYRAYYGGQVSAKKFSGAILTVAKAAMKFCRSEDSAAKFYNEKIADGQALLMSLRGDIHEALNKTDNRTKYDLVRELIGSFICAQSSFYSNTNWVEMSGSNLYRDLGVNASSVLKIADPLQPTCNNCVQVNGSVHACSSNLISGMGLTSGYFRNKHDLGSGTTGKCSHGGVLDPSRLMVATGGINKETSDLRFSPHHHLHLTAGQSALKAAIDLFLNKDRGLLPYMGTEKFTKLMALGSGVTLCIIMDTTGSMWDDIKAVAKQTQNLVTQRAQTVHKPERYIFVPFADPESGPVYVTTDADEFIRHLDSVVPNGGGDCPEMSLRGMLQGLEASSELSELFVFTDATAKDGELANRVIASALTKQITPQFLLTGVCEDLNVPFLDLYKTIADQTGGNVFYSSKADIEEITGLIDLLSGADQVSLQKLSSDGSTTDFIIPIDSSMRDVSVFVSTGGSNYLPGMTLYTPSDLTVQSDIQTTHFVAYDVTNVTSGNWRLHLDSPMKDVTVEVVGASSLDVQLELYQQTENGIAFPIEGKPISGSAVIMGVSVLDSMNVRNFSSVVLIGDNGQIISRLNLTQLRDDFMTADVTIPNQGFRVLLTGSDSSGNTIHRLVDSYYEPQDFWIELETVTPVRLIPGTPIEVNYTIFNSGNEETFVVSIMDDTGLVNISVHLPVTSTGNASGSFFLTIDESLLENYGSFGLVSVIASSSSGSFAANFKTFRVHVTNEEAVSGSDIRVDYIRLESDEGELPPRDTGKSTNRQADEKNMAAIVGGVCSFVTVVGVASFLSISLRSKLCMKTVPFNYPKTTPTVSKAKLRQDFSFIL